MIIRATKQLLRLSGIHTAIHFLHNPTRISVLVPGASLDSTIPIMRDRIEDLEFEDIFRTGKELKDITTPARILNELMSKLP